MSDPLIDAANAISTASPNTRAFAQLADRLAFWWLRKRNPNGVTVMATAGEQWALANYDKLAGTERS